MSDEHLSKAELLERLARAEAIVKALRQGEIDLIIGRTKPLVVQFKRLADQKERLKNLLNVVRRINQLIIYEADPNKLLQSAVNYLGESNVFYAAWIEQRDKAGKKVRAVEYGWHKMLRKESTELTAGIKPRCLTDVTPPSDTIIISDPLSVCNGCPFKGCLDERCVIEVPLIHKEILYGILLISAPKSMLEETDSHKLCAEIGIDLGFALYRIGLEKARDKMEKTLREREEHYRCLFENTGTALIVVNQDASIAAANEECKTITGYAPQQLKGTRWMDYVEPGSLKMMMEFFKMRFTKPKLAPNRYETRLVNAKGDIRDCILTVGGIKSTRQIIVSILDITELKNTQKEIKNHLKEKEILLQELYHRTKNNMQVIISMIRLKSRTIQNEELQFVFRDIENKIYSMALVHQKLYESGDLSSLNLKTYFNDLVTLIRQSYLPDDDRIHLICEAEDVLVLIDTAISLGLVINELLSNAVKHAFPAGRKGKIRMTLSISKDQELRVEVSDNGVGLPKGFDMEKDKKLGLENVINIVKQQLGGEVTFKSENGLSCLIVIKKELYKARI